MGFMDNVYNATVKAAQAKQTEVENITGDGIEGGKKGEDLGDPFVMLKLEKTMAGLSTAFAGGGGIIDAMKKSAEQLANKV